MPVDRGVIDAQLREIGEGDRWWEMREFRALPHVLHAGERILGVATGRLLGSRRPRLPAAPWLLVATDQRLLCLKQERFARKQIEFAPEQIVRVQQSGRLRTIQIMLQTPLRRYRLRIPKADAFRFAGALAALLPEVAAQRLPAHLEQWAWIPGLTRAAALPGVAGIVSKVSMLSPPDYATRDHADRLEAVVERLQEDVERLQQQVAFLENLLRERSEAAYSQRSAGE